MFVYKKTHGKKVANQIRTTNIWKERGKRLEKWQIHKMWLKGDL
jgi:hypothetical protein